MTTADPATYLVGTWTMPGDDATLRSGLWRLTPGPEPQAIPVDPTATAIYWATPEADRHSLLLLNNDEERSSLLRWSAESAESAETAPRWSSGGIGGSYLAFHPSGRYFVVANSSDGWSLFGAGEQPTLLGTYRNVGSGPHPRQAHSHPHCGIFTSDGEWIYVADMGTDEVLALSFDLTHGFPGRAIRAHHAPPGSGPRHLVFGDGVVYLLNELGNTVQVLRPRADRTLQNLQTVSTLPPGSSDETWAAHLGLAPDGRHLYATNRGHDSIVVYEVLDDGRLEVNGWVSSGGRWPWHFLFTDESKMLVCNNQSDEVSVFDIGIDGEPHQVGRVSIPRPVCIVRE